ncbi:MAG TPA: SusD/RagB family nutrient-binding outer membrane lipoprotein [Chitinophagaceae bacterium]
MTKTFFNKIVIATVMCSIAITSCTKDFTEINTDPNNTPAATPQQLLAPALVSTMTYNMLRNRNFNNELMQVSVNINDGEGQVFRYDYRANWADYLWNGWYSELTNFKDIDTIAREQLYFNNSYQGISLICQSWIYSLLTDTYGDVPYFESNKAKKELGGIIEPKFDKQKDIYLDIFKQLEKANELLKSNTAIPASSDPVFYGNISRWRKFGNSLYLRLLLRISGKAEVSAEAIAKIKDIVETNAANYPIMTSNDESAILRFTGVPPYTSPLVTVREQDFRFPGIASFFIDNLVVWNDPRIDISLGTNGINRWAIAPYQGAFTGIPSGYVPGTVPDKKSYFYSMTSTSSLQTEPLAGMILNYAELKFILAEAALKGWISSSAETHYNEGVQASIKQWLPNWNVPVTTYLQNADMQWATATTMDMRMERIHLMKYYALFLVDLQQWFEYRRTGRPILPKGAGLKNNGIMPARMTYPVYVQSTNPTNYKAAVAAQGPDVISTQVWWQKP